MHFPFFSEHKLDIDKGGVIIELSWPDKVGVNYFAKGKEYLDTAFKLYYPSVDTFVSKGFVA